MLSEVQLDTGAETLNYILSKVKIPLFHFSSTP